MNPTIILAFLRKYWKEIIIAVVIIALIVSIIIIIRRRQRPQQSDIDFQPGETTTIDPARRAYIESLAQSIYKDINDTPIGPVWYPPFVGAVHTDEYYQEANALTDYELLFLSQYYFTFLTQGSETLYAALDGEFELLGRWKTDLQTHLRKIGQGQ